jgi:hypothetical protein
MQFTCSLLHCHCVLSGFTVFFYVISYMVRFSKKKLFSNVFFPLYKIRLKHFSFSAILSVMWSKMFTCLHVKYSLFLPDSNETEFYGQILEKYSHIKFHQNPSNGRRVVSRGRTEAQTDRHTDITNLIVTIGNFAEAPNI